MTNEPLATELMCFLAFSSLEAQILKVPLQEKLISAIPIYESAIFVTFKQRDQLRGCIGTFEARDLAQQIQRYSIEAGTRDIRFTPLEKHELNEYLAVEVSLLYDFENCTIFDWEIGVHGLILYFRGRSATFLPEIAAENGWTQITTIQQLLTKTGEHTVFDYALLVEIRLVRYRTSHAAAEWKEYVDYLENGAIV